MKQSNKKISPTTLYRYRPLGDSELIERELDAIRESYLYAPSFEQMNDPMEALFEFSSISDDPISLILPPDFLLKYEKTLEETARTARGSGLISMSETHLDYPLWAYYGSNFSGMCLEFDTNELVISDLPRDSILPIPVIYDSTSPDAITFETLAWTDPIAMVISRLSQKRAEWMHEKEWRYLAGRPGRKLYADTALKRIYLGPRISADAKLAIVDAMKNRPVEIFEGTVHGYEINFLCIKAGTRWDECERTGEGSFDEKKVLSSVKELRSALGESYAALQNKCNELSTHPNVKSIDFIRLLNDQTQVCISVTYRLRDTKGDLSHGHFFDIRMNPIPYSELLGMQ